MLAGGSTLEELYRLPNTYRMSEVALQRVPNKNPPRHHQKRLCRERARAIESLHRTGRQASCEPHVRILLRGFTTAKSNDDGLFQFHYPQVTISITLL